MTNRPQTSIPPALASAVTLYTVSFPQTGEAIIPVSDSITVKAIGTGADGATTYVQEAVESIYIEHFGEPIITVSAGVTTTFTSSVTTTRTLSPLSTVIQTFVEDAKHWSFHKDAVPTGTSPEDFLGTDVECDFGDDGTATCVQKLWEVEATKTILSTVTGTGTGKLIPFYTLDVSDASATTTSPSASATGNSAAPGIRFPEGTAVGWGMVMVGVLSAWALKISSAIYNIFHYNPFNANLYASEKANAPDSLLPKTDIPSAMRLPSLIIAGSLPLTALTSAVTLYTISFPQTGDIDAIIPVSDSITVKAIGTGADGATTYLEEVVESIYIENFYDLITTVSAGVTTTFTSSVTTTTTLSPPFTGSQTFVEDAKHWSFHKDAAPTGPNEDDFIGTDIECDFGDDGTATCVQNIWEIEATKTILSTATLTGTGKAIPFYTLDVSDASATTMSSSASATEHMEEDEDTPKSIPPWVELEYSHMRTLAGPDSEVHFTHLSKSSVNSLSDAFNSSRSESLAEARCHEEGVLYLMKSKGISLDKVCLLDPKAEKALSPEDGDGRFDMFLFGGILGDDPPRDRTGELRIMGFPTRHLGPVQMTTDTALGVTKRVIKDGLLLDKVPYVDFPTIRFNAKESVEMPFRMLSVALVYIFRIANHYVKGYIVASDGKEPVLPPGMRELLHEDLNKGFEF
ncbi:hypothetical protein H0H93_008070 [Arthromyces matolae]|nr:hypothetical protein H0H93_008070 [Arthromyces matolae]